MGSTKQASAAADSATIWLVQAIATLDYMEACQRMVGGSEVGRDEDLILFAAGDGPADAEGKTEAEVYAITVRKLTEDEITDVLDHERNAQAHRDLSTKLDAEDRAFREAEGREVLEIG